MYINILFNRSESTNFICPISMLSICFNKRTECEFSHSPYHHSAARWKTKWSFFLFEILMPLIGAWQK